MPKVKLFPAVLVFPLIAIVGTANAQSRRIPASADRQSTAQPATQQSTQPDAQRVSGPLWTAADTGRMMPGDRTFTRHTPGMCIAVLESVRKGVWRRYEWDTAAKGPGLDTLPTVALQIGRTCAAQFDESDTSDVHLRDLMRLRTFLGDRAGAQAATAKRLSRASSDTARGTILFDVVKAELRNSPVHMPSVYAALERVDALGDGAAVARLLAHDTVRTYALFEAFDSTAVVHEGRQIVALRPLLTAPEQSEFCVAATNLREWYLAWYRVPDSTLSSVIDSMAQVSARDADRPGSGGCSDYIQRWGKVATATAMVVGTPVPPLTGTYWYNKPEHITYPEPGKVTLIYNIGSQLNNGSIEHLERIRRMQEKYGSAGLQVILLAHTDGTSWESPKQSPINEANTLAWFLLEQLQLPFPLLINYENNLPAIPGVNSSSVPMLVGRDGKVRSVGVGTNNNELMIDALIKQTLDGK